MLKPNGNRLATVGAAVALVVIAVGGYTIVRAALPGDSPTAGGASVLVEAAQPAGTPIGDGFVVPEGSQLVGDVFPIQRMIHPGGRQYVDPSDHGDTGSEPPPLPDVPLVPESGWIAVMVTGEGDVLTPFADLVGQAEALGFGLQTSPRYPICRGLTEFGDREVPLEQLPADLQPVRVTCLATYDVSRSSASHSLESATDLTVSASAGLDKWGQPTQSHLRLEFTRTGSGEGDPPPGTSLLRAEDIPTATSVASKIEPQLPVAGQSLAPEIDGAASIDLVIPAEATAAMSATHADCLLGWLQILTTADGADAFDNLIQQATDSGYTEPVFPSAEIQQPDRTTSAVYLYNGSAEASIALWLVDPLSPTTPDSILVDFCGA